MHSSLAKNAQVWQPNKQLDRATRHQFVADKSDIALNAYDDNAASRKCQNNMN
jgi:hypothetical protein